MHALAIQSYPSKIAKIGSTVSGKSLLLRNFFWIYALRRRSRPLGTVGLTGSSVELFQGSAREPQSLQRRCLLDSRYHSTAPMEHSRDGIFHRVAALIPPAQGGDGTLVGVEGQDASGKTIFANDLAAYCYQTLHRPVVQISIDNFHHPKNKT
jgi:hypothetical protein